MDTYCAEEGAVWTSHSVVCDSQEAALMFWWGLFALIYSCNRGWLRCVRGVYHWSCAEVIMRCSHEALEHFNCFICPPECPVIAENRQKGKAVDSQESYCNTKGLNSAPDSHFCLCKQLRVYVLRKSNFFRKRSRKWWKLYILFAVCYFDLPRYWPTQVFAPIYSYKCEE